jgi:hypothetical protein
MADQTTTAEVAKAGLEMVSSYAGKITEIISQYSGPAAELALAVGRVAAIKEIVTGVVCLIIAGVAAKLAFKFATKARAAYEFEQKKERYSERNDGPIAMPVIYTAGSTFIGVIMFFSGIGNVLNLFAWAGIFEPAVYLAAKALNLA